MSRKRSRIPEPDVVTELTDEAYRTMRTVLRVFQGVEHDVEETDPYVSTGQAAEILGVSARTVARHLDAGDIPCERAREGPPTCTAVRRPSLQGEARGKGNGARPHARSGRRRGPVRPRPLGPDVRPLRRHTIALSLILSLIFRQHHFCRALLEIPPSRAVDAWAASRVRPSMQGAPGTLKRNPFVSQSLRATPAAPSGDSYARVAAGWYSYVRL